MENKTYVLFFSGEQAKRAGVITVTTPEGQSYSYTERVEKNPEGETKPSGLWTDYTKVGEITDNPGNYYTNTKPAGYAQPFNIK